MKIRSVYFENVDLASMRHEDVTDYLEMAQVDEMLPRPCCDGITPPRLGRSGLRIMHTRITTPTATPRTEKAARHPNVHFQ